ncbi:MAG: sugar ABC transporter permease, partial [Clostridia bacterium]|nr:sugar ABC transporter permease [Clostridia bacterium]
LLISTARKTLIEAPLIVIFSLILAILLSKVRKMSGFFRVVLLLPFVLGTGEVMNQLISQGVDTRIISLTNSEIIPREWLLYIGSDFVTVLDTLFSSIIRILWQSSVQIVLFLSAILGISPALYESAKIDGANAYETFWKITLPMVSPVLLLNMIYTIIASFTDGSNRMLEFIYDYMLKYGNHGYAAALGWVYFVMVLLIIGVVALVLGRYVKANQGYGGKR